MKRPIFIFAFLLFVLTMVSVVPTAHAATYIVDKGGVSTNACATTGVSPCTLPDAMTYANSQAGPDIIRFNIPDTEPGCTAVNTCTITLGANLPDVTEEMEIDGSANSGHITVDGASSFSIFRAFANFTLNAVTVANAAGGSVSGGLYVDNGVSVTVSNSTFRSNNASDVNGAGHIYNDGGTVTIVNSTFFNVIQGVGIRNNSGTMNVYNVTIDGNNATSSQGVRIVAGTVNLYNTIVVNNATADCNATGGTFTADSFNIDEDGFCDSATSWPYAQVHLMALADNGGPTQTMALNNFSTAINAGNDTVCGASPVSSLDQRGVARPQGAHCDVGAYEAPTTTAVNVSNLKAAVNTQANVVLKWRTFNEAQISGFNVYRQTKAGAWKQINANFKPAKNPGDALGNAYRFTDRKVQSGNRYRYMIEVKYLDGRSEWTQSVRVRLP